MADYKTKMKLKYKIVSTVYDNLYGLLENIVFFKDKKNPRLALTHKIPNEDFHILDVCCGTGKSCISIAGNKGIITGIDLSSDMLKFASEKAKKKCIKNIFFYEMDATKMDFDDEKFDIVVTSFGLHEMNYDLMMKVLKEIYRVLKKKGLLYIVDYGKEDGFVMKIIFSMYLKICYPQHVQDFLNYDWKEIFNSVGFRLDYIEKYAISQLICAVKE
ncbi:MAG: class I SAM-dependent methyltransferase [Desulfobacterales bacterium]|nr:class I SAM-dependent methyltransferase [Desulfobacterales bacterium]